MNSLISGSNHCHSWFLNGSCEPVGVLLNCRQLLSYISFRFMRSLLLLLARRSEAEQTEVRAETWPPPPPSSFVGHGKGLIWFWFFCHARRTCSQINPFCPINIWMYIAFNRCLPDSKYRRDFSCSPSRFYLNRPSSGARGRIPVLSCPVRLDLWLHDKLTFSSAP